MQDIGGEVLCVSQFTLLASTKKGSKPDFHGALGGDEARRLYQYFFEKVQQGYASDKVKDGVFQAMMEVALVNDGPVRLWSWLLSSSQGTCHTNSKSKVTLELNVGPQQKTEKVEKSTVKTTDQPR